MRSFLAKRLLQGAMSSARSGLPCGTAGAGSPSRPEFSSSRCYAVAASLAQEEAETVTFSKEGPGVSYGLSWDLAGRGVSVKDRTFYNLSYYELRQVLQKDGVKTIEPSSGFPVYFSGKTASCASEISKAQFSKLLKQASCGSWLVGSLVCL